MPFMCLSLSLVVKEEAGVHAVDLKRMGKTQVRGIESCVGRQRQTLPGGTEAAWRPGRRQAGTARWLQQLPAAFLECLMERECCPEAWGPLGGSASQAPSSARSERLPPAETWKSSSPENPSASGVWKRNRFIFCQESNAPSSSLQGRV